MNECTFVCVTFYPNSRLAFFNQSKYIVKFVPKTKFKTTKKRTQTIKYYTLLKLLNQQLRIVLFHRNLIFHFSTYFINLGMTNSNDDPTNIRTRYLEENNWIQQGIIPILTYTAH